MQTVQTRIKRFAADPDKAFCDTLSGSALFINVFVNVVPNFVAMVNIWRLNLRFATKLYNVAVQKNDLHINPSPQRDNF